MNLRKAILSVSIVLMAMPVFSQTDIEYNHKTLVKVLQKAGIQDLKTLKEMMLPDSMASILPINGKYFEIATENSGHYKYLYVGRVHSCRAGGCSISDNTLQEENSEYFDYSILFDESLSVRLVKVFNYQATHGQEITAKGWLKQFVGFDGNEELMVGKDIDTVSGATISVNAITEDIAQKSGILKKIVWKHFGMNQP